jgi:hypothetical protein
LQLGREIGKRVLDAVQLLLGPFPEVEGREQLDGKA